MCGISGVFAFSEDRTNTFSDISVKFRKQLHQRGPDRNDEFVSDSVLLTHNRLSVIDITERADQPMRSEDGNYIIVFNGEIFNFKALRNELQAKGYQFFSESDTEVVLKLFMSEGISFLNKLSGFFAFAIYDRSKDELILARDRFGIKPLLFTSDERGFAFSSEMKSLLECLDPQELDHASLKMFFRLTYIPPPYTIFKRIQKLNPGCYLIVKDGQVEKRAYTSFAFNRYKPDPSKDYAFACSEIYKLLDTSVSEQLISDVPVGCFLSGGIDSSIITALASKHTNHLKTFSVGFPESPYFNESKYAEIVAKRHKTDHTSFLLTNDDLFAAVESMLDYIDEPFADSSALAVYVLSRETRKHVTVALSGDGADELFGGYNKHIAELRIRNKLFQDMILRPFTPLLNILPASRSGRIPDQVRKLRKYFRAYSMSIDERYRFLTAFNDEEAVERLLISYGLHDEFSDRWNHVAPESDSESSGIEDVLLSDVQLVLTGDMLPKVDMMSMANSLEVRPPFLDSRIVDFAFSIPTKFKISKQTNKKILRDAFKHELPPGILARPKHGFEVPMNIWFSTHLRSMIDRYLQSSDFIENQKLFRYDVISSLVQNVFTRRNHDLQSFIWSLIVFQYWYEKYEHHIKKDWM